MATGRRKVNENGAISHILSAVALLCFDFLCQLPESGVRNFVSTSASVTVIAFKPAEFIN
jgi:hypothetical protein